VIIEIGNDHRGFVLKEKVKQWLEAEGHIVHDHGCESGDSSDYPDYAFAAARAVSKTEGARGIVICSNGIGVSMAANKVPGIRAALCVTDAMASQSRRHNDSNVLAIGADNAPEAENMTIIKTWLATEFEGGRHQKRVDKLMQDECCGGHPVVDSE
jgi:RpiB/LacA/LacB family sugar-phosphate isomerase